MFWQLLQWIQKRLAGAGAKISDIGVWRGKAHPLTERPQLVVIEADIAYSN